MSENEADRIRTYLLSLGVKVAALLLLGFGSSWQTKCFILNLKYNNSIITLLYRIYAVLMRLVIKRYNKWRSETQAVIQMKTIMVLLKY